MAKQTTKHGASSAGKGVSRAERLAAALRENLRRRKSQARGRSHDGGGQSHDSAEFVPNIASDKG